MACFDKDVNETAITEIARQHSYYFVLRDSSLATDGGGFRYYGQSVRLVRVAE